VNREMKRMLQRQGQLEADGTAAVRRPPPPRVRPREQGIPESLSGRVLEFAREVRGELRQVAWPSRAEVVNSSVVVLIVLVLLVGLIFLLNYLLAHGVEWLFQT
jgi:preprotein translocase subunit SecE